MSNDSYNKLWDLASQQLEEQFTYEDATEPGIVPKSRDAAYQHVATLYAKYIQIFRKLEACHDQMVHPQKRLVIRDTMIAVMGRLTELKNKMIELQSSDYQNLADIMIDLKLTPEDLQIPIPKFFNISTEQTKNERMKILSSLEARKFAFDEGIPAEIKLSLDDAIRIIQMYERGRQGKLRAVHMRELKKKANERIIEEKDEKTEMNRAALYIQRIYKGFKARKQYEKLKREDYIFLGMLPAPIEDADQDPIRIQEKNKIRRRLIQDQHQEEYQQALQVTREKIYKLEGPDIKEDIQDEFRQFYLDYKAKNQSFPDFPEDSQFFSPNFQFGQQNQQAESSQKEAANKKPAADPKQKGKEQQQATEDPLANMSSSVWKDAMKLKTQHYQTEWKTKNETGNFFQKHDQELVKKEKRIEVELQIKKEIIEILKEELENLKISVDKEKAKGKKGKKDKSKKGKKGGKKGKKDKDLTADIPMEQLVEELVNSGIMQKYDPVQMSQFKGSLNLMNFSTEKVPVIQPFVGEVPRIITEFCILPLSVPLPPPLTEEEEEEEQVKQPRIPLTPTLLYGPSGTGKTMLVNAIATATNAYIFNLSPRNTAGQYLGKANTSRMIQTVFKVAKANAPSIIYIDNFEMIFAKKVPKTDLSDPKRMKKDLIKQLKNLDQESGVLFIASSHKPWDGDVKSYLGLFARAIFCPKPDYGTRYSLWTSFIHQKTKRTEKVDFSTLARESNGLSAGDIKKITNTVLVDRRLATLKTSPLKALEFLNSFPSLSELAESAEQDKMFKEFFEKTPLVRGRMALLNPDQANSESSKKK